MVDPVGAKPLAADGTARIAAAAPVAPVAPAASATTAATRTDPAKIGGLAQHLAASAPVDIDRVATIKKAIAEGRFPILPATIADRLLALKLHWNPNESLQHDQA